MGAQSGSLLHLTGARGGMPQGMDDRSDHNGADCGTSAVMVDASHTAKRAVDVAGTVQLRSSSGLLNFEVGESPASTEAIPPRTHRYGRSATEQRPG